MSEEELLKKENPSIEELWDEVRVGYIELTKDLPKKIPYDPKLSIKKRLPLTAQYIKGGLKYRTVNLAKTAMKLFEEEDGLLSAIIITRSMVETVSLLFCLHERLGKVVETEQVGDIEKFINQMGLGGRFEPLEIDGEEIEALNVLSAIDKLDKIFKGVRKEYDFLSEYAHPNCHGTLMFFSQLKEEENCIELSFDALSQKIEKPHEHMLRTLSLCIVMFIFFERKINKLMPEFNEICNKERDR